MKKATSLFCIEGSWKFEQWEDVFRFLRTAVDKALLCLEFFVLKKSNSGESADLSKTLEHSLMRIRKTNLSQVSIIERLLYRLMERYYLLVA